MEEKKSILSHLNSIVLLLTSVIALGASVYSITTSLNNKEDISQVKTSIYSKAEKIKETFSISYPKYGAQFEAENFQVHGIYNGDLEDIADSKLWIITYDEDGYQRNARPVNISANNKWFHDNIYYSKMGPFKLMVVITNEEGTDWIKSMQNHKPEPQWIFNELHRGAQILDYIELEHIN